MEIDVTRTYELWEQSETCVRLKPGCDGTLVTCKINGFTVYIYKKNVKTERESESTLVTEAFDDFFMIYLHKTLNKSSESHSVP